MNYVISVDWFQYYCKCAPTFNPIFGTYFTGCSKNTKGYISQYYVDECPEFHSMFRKGITIKLHKFPLVHIHYDPKPSTMAWDAVAVKVTNRALYSASWSFYLHDIIEALGLRICGITRVDLCCDFQHFHDGLLPNTFIQRYLNNGISKKKCQYVRVGGNSFCVHGKKRIRYEDSEKKENILGTSNHLDYIRWGSRQSGVCTYLYNKSQELLDKKSKPYIKQMWEDSGIVVNPDLPVYRLEFSVSSKAMNLRPVHTKKKHIGMNPSLMRQLNKDDFATQQNIEQTFWVYANRYFRFRKVGKQKYRKDMPIVQLWDAEVETFLKPSYFNTSCDTGVAERRAAKCIQRLLFKYPDLPSHYASSINTFSDCLRYTGFLKEKLEKFNEDGLDYFRGKDLTAWKQLQRAGVVTSVQTTAMEDALEHAVAKRFEELMGYAEFTELWDKRQAFIQMAEELRAVEDEIQQVYNDYADTLSYECS